MRSRLVTVTVCRRHWTLALDRRAYLVCVAAPRLARTFISPCCRTHEAPSKEEPAGRPPSRVGPTGHAALPAKGASGGDGALAPIIDLANYGAGEHANAELRNAPKEAGWGSSDELAVALYARHPIKAGTEVLIDYGSGEALTNERLL